MSDKRGTCPRCGSGEVTHYTFGLVPFGGEPGKPWEVARGCVVQGPARHCEACGYEWGHGMDPSETPEQRASRDR